MSPVAPKQKRRRLILLSTIILLALFCWAYFAPSKLDRYKAQLIAQGEILDLDKIAPKRTGHEPDGDAPLLAAQQKITNGLPLQIGWFKFEHTERGYQHLQWEDPTGITNQPNWTNAIAQVSSLQNDFLYLHQLLKDPPKEKGGDYRDIENYKVAHTQLRRGIARHLHHALIVSAYARDPSLSFTNLTTLLNLAQLHREEWDTSSQSTRIEITKLLLEDLNYCLHLHFWEEQQLAEIQASLSAISLVTNYVQSMIIVRAQRLALFSSIRQDPQAFLNRYFQPQASKELRTIYWRNFDIDNDALSSLRPMQFQLEVFREQANSPAWANACSQLDKASDEFFEADQLWWNKRRFGVTYLFHYRLDNSSAYDLAYAETRRQQAITVLALERYRLKLNHYPDTLTQLIPDYLTKLPQDPMDGRPMRYRLNPDATFTLWSSGFDGKDNGGDPSILSVLRFPNGNLDLPWPRIDPADLPPKP